MSKSKKGKLEGVNLTGEAVALLKVAGVSLDQAKATAFSTLETDFMIKQGIVNIQRLLADSHDFQATGNGTVGFDQPLNLAVNLNLSQGMSQKIAGLIACGEDGDERWTASSTAPHHRDGAESFLWTWIPKPSLERSKNRFKRKPRQRSKDSSRHDQTLRSQEGRERSVERIARSLKPFLRT